MTRPKRPYTEGEILRAIKLYAALGDWSEVAGELDRSVSSLATTVSNYRRGRWCTKRHRERTASREAYLERAVEAGLTTTEMAAHLGIERASVQTRLEAMGWDAESRQEIARSLGKSIWPVRDVGGGARRVRVAEGIRGGLQVAEMAAALGVTTRTINRDIAVLGHDKKTRQEIARSQGRSIWPRRTMQSTPAGVSSQA